MNVAVVGAGVSGLTAAWRLQQAGHRIVVFEREARVGGRMATVDVGGFRIDVGANLMLENYARLRALADEVGLGDQWFAFHAGRGGIQVDGRIASVAPTSLGDLLRPDGLSIASRARLLAFLVRSWHARGSLDFFDLGTGDPALDTVDAWTGASEACGPEVVELLVDPFVRTFHFHSARKLSMKYFAALAALFMDEGGFVPHGFRGFMQALPDALAARLDVRTGTAVEAVRPVDGGVEVVVAGEAGRYDAVVVATTASVARRVLVAPTARQAAVLDGVAYAPTLMSSFRVPAEAAGDFEGIWIPFGESAIVSDCANEACKGARQGDDVVLTLGLHEEAATLLLDAPDDVVLGLVANEWGRLAPACRGRMTGLHVHRWREAMPVYGVGHLNKVQAFWESGQGEGRVWLAGDWLNHPWLEGSVRCGERVAGLVDAALAHPGSSSR
jgi:oxygen-dependent protoporphyrinogen oxidase